VPAKARKRQKVVSFYDYYACGTSALTPLAPAGNAQALRIIHNVLRNCDHYRTRPYDQPMVDGSGTMRTPLRRLLLHLALVYRDLQHVLGDSDEQRIRDILEQQVPIAIEHNKHFLPGERNLHVTFANNHTAIVMQAIWCCGRVLGRDKWCERTREFAERFHESGHPDGYWEERTNIQRVRDFQRLDRLEDRRAPPADLTREYRSSCHNDTDGGRHTGDLHAGIVRARETAGLLALLSRQRGPGGTGDRVTWSRRRVLALEA